MQNAEARGLSFRRSDARRTGVAREESGQDRAVRCGRANRRAFGAPLAPFALLALAAPLLSGCALPDRLQRPQRYERGVVYILPGVEGRSVWNTEIALGLDEGGLPDAIEVFDWTTGLPGAILLNLVDLERNRQQAGRLARRIATYHEQNPAAPVYLIGYSGGGGVAVLTLEALPAGVVVDMAILLAPALARFAADGSHLGWAARRFAKEYLTPLMRDGAPPASALVGEAARSAAARRP